MVSFFASPPYIYYKKATHGSSILFMIVKDSTKERCIIMRNGRVFKDTVGGKKSQRSYLARKTSTAPWRYEVLQSFCFISYTST